MAIAEQIVFRIVTQTHLILERSKSCSLSCETSADSQGNPESQKNECSLVKCRPSAGLKLHMGRHVKRVTIKYEHLVSKPSVRAPGCFTVKHTAFFGEAVIG